MSLAVLFLGLATALTGDAAPSNRLAYVKKPTRDETYAASLAATGVRVKPGHWSQWKYIGPFDNTAQSGFAAKYPPEREIDAAKSYPGKGQATAMWKAGNFPDGKINDLNLFEPQHNQDAVVYLLREITVDKPVDLPVSLGSDDSLKVFLNGAELVAADALRPCAPDQHLLKLRLSAGRNQLLLKVGQISGNWQFYFSPVAPASVVSQLRNRLDIDFPPDAESKHYRIVNFPISDELRLEIGGMGFLKSGDLLVGTRRGQILLVKNPLDESWERFEIREWASGLHEITGMTVVGDDVYVCQRPELTLIKDTDGDGKADSFRTFCDGWGISGDYHEYAFGPARDQAGNFFVTLNVGFGGGHQSKAPWRGWCVKVDPRGKLTPFAVGLRSPNGVGVSPDNEVFYCDNQGEWVAACKLHHVREGEYYGHPAGLRWKKDLRSSDRRGQETRAEQGSKAEQNPPKPVPPCVWFPYGSMSQSASEPIWDTSGGKLGPFAGQCLVGDQTKSLIMRVALEKVNGRYQGACFHFRRGFDCGVNRLTLAHDGSILVGMTSRGWGSVGGKSDGLQRLVYTGRPPFDMHSVRLKKSGFEIRFTEPVDPKSAGEIHSYTLQSYHYNYWSTYGSPEEDRRPVPATFVHVSADGRSVFLEVPNLKTGKVYEIIAAGIRSKANQPLLHPEAYYTLNQLPN